MSQPLLQPTQSAQGDRMMKSWQTVMMDLHCWWKRLMWSDLMAVTEERQRTKTGAQTGEAHTRKIWECMTIVHSCLKLKQNKTKPKQKWGTTLHMKPNGMANTLCIQFVWCARHWSIRRGLPLRAIIGVDIGEPSAKKIIFFSCEEYSFVFFFSTHYYAVIAVVGVYAKTNFHVTPVQ